jgi:hypothetical protein
VDEHLYAAERRANLDEAVRGPIRPGSEQHAVDDRECRRRRADAQTERADDYERECGTLPQCTDCVGQIESGTLERSGASMPSADLHCHLPGTRERRGRPRIGEEQYRGASGRTEWKLTRVSAESAKRVRSGTAMLQSLAEAPGSRTQPARENAGGGRF